MWEFIKKKEIFECLIIWEDTMGKTNVYIV